MPTKPKKVQGGGVGVFVDGKLMSRLQSFTVDTDLGVEEIRELTNRNVVEFVEGIPTVTVQMEANQWGKRNNIAAVTGEDGTVQKQMQDGGTGWREIIPASFNGTSADIVVQVEEDTTLKRSMYIGNAFLTSLNLSYDVGGVATESYTLEADNTVWYAGTPREIVVVSGHYLNTIIKSGIVYNAHPDLISNAYFNPATINKRFTLGETGFTPLFMTKNGVTVVDTTNGVPLAPRGHLTSPPTVTVPDPFWYAQISGAGRFRVVGYKQTANSVITAGTTDGGASPIGGIRKGMIQIFLASGSTYRIGTSTDDEEFLRLQTASIDADLSREALDELGNFQSFDRSLNLPISVTVNFSALADDLQTWSGFANQRGLYESDSLTSIQFRDFLQTAAVIIRIFNDDEGNVSRQRLMTVAVSGIRVASTSFSVDAGGNAVQEFSCTADNFTIS
jgi:hypothetical protein